MLSLQKTYDQNELNKWAEVSDAVGTLKIDGNSLSLIYEKGKLTLAKTRGNGRVGEDVTEKAQWVSDVIPQLKDPIDVEVRGELYCTASQFSIVTDKMESLGLDRPTNPRNIVAGFLGRKAYFDLCRYFSFFGFEVLFPEGVKPPFKTEMEKFSWLEEQGFPLPLPKKISGEDQMSAFLDSVRKVMSEGEIGIDGAVFSYDKLSYT